MSQGAGIAGRGSEVRPTAYNPASSLTRGKEVVVAFMKKGTGHPEERYPYKTTAELGKEAMVSIAKNLVVLSGKVLRMMRQYEKEIIALKARLEGSERAMLRLYRARVARREAQAALRAYRQEHGSCAEHGNLSPCYSRRLAIDEWCEACGGSQPFWELRRKAYIEATAALVSLLNMAKAQQRPPVGKGGEEDA